MKVLLLFAMIALCWGDHFSEWMAQHNKTYSSPAEMNRRSQIFQDNLELIASMNVEARRNSKDTLVIIIFFKEIPFKNGQL
jgi:hypothetical protein